MTKQGFSSKGFFDLRFAIIIWRIVNRKSVRRTIAAAGWWSLEQDLVAGAGLDSWYKTGIRWIGGRRCRTSFCWCRKLVAGSGWYLLVQESGRWFRTGSCLCRTGSCWYLLVQEGGRWCRTDSYWYLLVQESDRWCRKTVAGSGLVVAGAQLVTAGICWCRKAVAGAGLAAAGAELVNAPAGRSPVQVW